jgi:hypothetical protein
MSLENARWRSPVRSPFTPTIRIAVILLPQKSRPDGKCVGQSTSPSSTLRIYTGPARKTRKTMCYLGVGTTPLKRGVKPPQSAFSRLFRSPSGSDGFWSPSGSNEKRRRRPSGFDGQNCRDSERGIRAYRRFKLSAAAGRHGHTSAPMQTCGWCSYDCRWNRGSERDGHSCGKRDGTLVQVVSCGWKAQPHFCTNAGLWLVLIRLPRQRIGYLRIPPMESWF